MVGSREESNINLRKGAGGGRFGSLGNDAPEEPPKAEPFGRSKAANGTSLRIVGANGGASSKERIRPRMVQPEPERPPMFPPPEPPQERSEQAKARWKRLEKEERNSFSSGCFFRGCLVLTVLIAVCVLTAVGYALVRDSVNERLRKVTGIVSPEAKKIDREIEALISKMPQYANLKDSQLVEIAAIIREWKPHRERINTMLAEARAAYEAEFANPQDVLREVEGRYATYEECRRLMAEIFQECRQKRLQQVEELGSPASIASLLEFLYSNIQSRDESNPLGRRFVKENDQWLDSELAMNHMRANDYAVNWQWLVTHTPQKTGKQILRELQQQEEIALQKHLESLQEQLKASAVLRYPLHQVGDSVSLMLKEPHYQPSLFRASKRITNEVLVRVEDSGVRLGDMMIRKHEMLDEDLSRFYPELNRQKRQEFVEQKLKESREAFVAQSAAGRSIRFCSEMLAAGYVLVHHRGEWPNAMNPEAWSTGKELLELCQKQMQRWYQSIEAKLLHADMLAKGLIWTTAWRRPNDREWINAEEQRRRNAVLPIEENIAKGMRPWRSPRGVIQWMTPQEIAITADERVKEFAEEQGWLWEKCLDATGKREWITPAEFLRRKPVYEYLP